MDLTTFLSGPFCTQLLGDLGAEVIKVEHPDGDLTRHIPPHFVGSDSAYFLSTNRNKYSVVADLKTEGGLRVVKGLLAESDVLVENFRPGVAKRLGLDYELLADEQPRLIWCSVTGFGQNGPLKDHPAYDMVIQALAGVMSLTGEPGRRGVRTGVPLSDLVGGLYAAIAILASLHERDLSGRGQFLDISLLDAVTSLLSYQAAYHLIAGVVPGPQGSGHDSIPTYRTFTAKDGRDVCVTANTDRMWESLCEVIGLPDLPADPRFATLADRHANRRALWQILEKRFEARTSDEWVGLLANADVPASAVNTIDLALQLPQLTERDMILELEDGSSSHVRVLGNPVKMSRSHTDSHRYPPALGQDTREVLRTVLGLSNEDIGALAEAGAIGANEPAQEK